MTVSFQGKVLSKKCRDHREYCPTLVYRRCQVKKLKNGCSRKVCCVFKKRGKHITKRCRPRRLKCPKVIKRRCKTIKTRKCSTRQCCKFRFVHTLNFWKKIKYSCRRVSLCKQKRKTCRWQHIGKNCFRRRCCTTVILNGKAVPGSRRCLKSIKKCRTSTRRRCRWIQGANKCKTKSCCHQRIKEGKVISNICRNIRKSCKIVTTRRCKRKQHENGCKFKICCKAHRRNGSVIYRRCEKHRGSCPSTIKKRCRIAKIGKCSIKSCCKFRFNSSKGIWSKLKRTCKTIKKCSNKIIRCRRIKLINNCYKVRCFRMRIVKGKVVSKKCEKSKKICLPRIVTRCVRRNDVKTKCSSLHCCKSIYFGGRVKSRTCVNRQRSCPATTSRFCKKKNVKKRMQYNKMLSNNKKK